MTATVSAVVPDKKSTVTDNDVCRERSYLTKQINIKTNQLDKQILPAEYQHKILSCSYWSLPPTLLLEFQKM